MEKFNWDSFVAETTGSYLTQAYSRLRNREEAEDVVQDTYVTLFEKYNGKPTKDLDRLGHKTLVYKCLWVSATEYEAANGRAYKNHKSIRKPTVFTVPLYHEGSMSSAPNPYLHDKDYIISTIKGVLSARQWTIMELVGQGYTYGEIMAKTGIPTGTIRSSVFYSRLKIHKLFPNYFT